mmetsp:Transcript_10040/g.25063  ORF Transcript_10040/g.25063 Transcript_10040/m.25063 type:complete len:258 (+) Transcript_10040:535-1308(+)
MRVHIKWSASNYANSFALPTKVTGEALHTWHNVIPLSHSLLVVLAVVVTLISQRQFTLDQTHSARKVLGTTVGQIIAIHAGQHHVAQAPATDGACGVLRLLRVEWRWRTRGLHRTKATGTSALLTHQHDGGGGGALRLTAAAPTLPDVRTLRLLADGAEAERTNVSLQPLELLAAAQSHAKPRWQAFLACAGPAAERRRAGWTVRTQPAAGLVAHRRILHKVLQRETVGGRADQRPAAQRRCSMPQALAKLASTCSQ